MKIGSVLSARTLVAGAATAFALAGVGSVAHAAVGDVETFNLDLHDNNPVGATSYGTITVTETATGLDYSVQLNSAGKSFAADPNKPEVLLFNLTGSSFTASNITATYDSSATGGNPNLQSQFSSVGDPSSPIASPGTFSYGIVCTSGCDYGTNNHLIELDFTIDGATLADMFPTSGNGGDPVVAYFAANLVSDGDASGQGRYVGAEKVIAATPEPSTWAMILLGFFGVGYLAYRKRKGTGAGIGLQPAMSFA
jgi:hypothetical protein